MADVNPLVLISALQNKLAKYVIEVNRQLAQLRKEFIRAQTIRPAKTTVNAVTQTTNDDQQQPSVGHSKSLTTTPMDDVALNTPHNPLIKQNSLPIENRNPPVKVYTARRSTGTTVSMVPDRAMDKPETSTDSKTSADRPKAISKIHDKCAPNESKIPVIDLTSPDTQPKARIIQRKDNKLMIVTSDGSKNGPVTWVMPKFVAFKKPVTIGNNGANAEKPSTQQPPPAMLVGEDTASQDKSVANPLPETQETKTPNLTAQALASSIKNYLEIGRDVNPVASSSKKLPSPRSSDTVRKPPIKLNRNVPIDVQKSMFRNRCHCHRQK